MAKKLTDQEKRIAEDARADWQAQCRASFQGIPFRDKSAKACFARHMAYAAASNPSITKGN